MGGDDRHQWRRFLVAAVGMVSTGFGDGPWKTLVGAFHVLRANQLWAPYPDNDPDGARTSMRRFYALVASQHDLDLDPMRASQLEVERRRLHRAHQHDRDVEESTLVQALVDLYAYVYSTEPEHHASSSGGARACDGPVRCLGRGGLRPRGSLAGAGACGAGRVVLRAACRGQSSLIAPLQPDAEPDAEHPDEGTRAWLQIGRT